MPARTNRPVLTKRAAFAFAALFAAVSALSVAGAVASAAEEPSGRGVRTIILVRHGAYDETDKRDPDVGRALTAEGREQARVTAERLAGLGVRVDALHSSTMTRARETAAIIGDALSLAPSLSRTIRECTPPTEREDIMARQSPEGLAACRDSLERAWERYFRPSPARDSLEVVVCHGNVIRFLTGKALGLAPDRWLRMSVGNCSLTTIRVRPDGSCQVLQVGDVGHLPSRPWRNNR